MNETTRRRRAALIVSSAPAAALLIGAMVVTASAASPADGTAETTSSVATNRDMSATLTADGVVESATTSVVVRGRTAAVLVDQQTSSASSSATDPGAAASAGSAKPVSLSPFSAEVEPQNERTDDDLGAQIELAAFDTGNTPTDSPEPTAPPTTAPTTPPTTTPTTPAPTTPAPTTAPPTTTAPTRPPTSAPPTTGPPAGTPPSPSTGGPTTREPTTLPPGGVPGPAARAAVTPSGRGLTSGTPSGAVSPQPQAGEPVPTLTAMADLARTVTTGTEVYAADGEPVVAILGHTPSWRTLKVGVENGPDVRTLEQALVKLGFGEGITVDQHFGSGTADAVTEWEESLDRADPDGEVDPDEIVLIASDSQVVDRTLAVGDPVPGEAQILTLAAKARVITVTVDADEVSTWAENATVTVRWADDKSFTGRISAVGHDISAATDDSDGTAEVTVVPESGSLKRRTGTPAEVDLITESRAGTVTVPVAALRDGPDGRPSVTVIKDGVSTVRPVGIGLVADGRAEVTAGLRPGERVQLP